VPLVLAGLNHETASVELRERLSLSSYSLGRGLDPEVPGPVLDLPGPVPGLSESILLSTCNRLEIYGVAGDAAEGLAVEEAFLAHLLDMPPAELRPHLYRMRDEAAAEHLLRVASGTDSMILGEPQILGQVAQALARARAAGSAGPLLRQLFKRAVHAGKRARSETAISRHATSASHAAVRLARATHGDLAHARVLVVGAGEMAEQAALALHDEGAIAVACLSRTQEHAERLAGRFGGRAFGWGHLAEALAEADVIITATAAPHTLIFREDVAPALSGRAGAPLVIVDIAVPRDVSPEVSGLPGVVLYDIDRVREAVDTNRAQREAALPQVEAIVQQETRDFCRWVQGRQVVPVLVEFRRQAESVAESEVELMLRRLENPDEHTKKVMELLAHRIVGKLLHEPTVRLKAEAANGSGAVYAEALRELFALDGSKNDSLPSSEAQLPSAEAAPPLTDSPTPQADAP
jgi:glutamyl-tRNA reductase